MRLGVRHSPPDLWIRKAPRQLIEESVGDNELEVAAKPALHHLRRGAGRRKHSGDQNVDVDNGAHLRATARGSLCFQSEVDRRLLIEAVLAPQTVEQIEAEVASQGLFNDLAVALAQAGGTNSHPAEDLLVE